MSGSQRFTDCEQRLHGAAYLLGALEPREHDSYREHLRECAICRQEIEHLRPALEALSLSAPPVRTPAQMRDRVMEIVRQEASLLAAAGPQADTVAQHRPQRRWRPLVPALAGVLAAVAIAVGIAIGLSASPSEKIIAATVSAAAPHGQAQLRQVGSQTQLVVSGMPQPPAGKIYEVWLARAGQEPQPTNALFGVTRTGSGSVAVPGDLHGVLKVMVTAEPLGGSQHPTSTPIIIATL